MAYTEAKKRGNRKWDASNLDRFSLAMKKGEKEKIKAAATAAGESMNEYIKTAVDMRMDNERPEVQP